MKQAGIALALVFLACWFGHGSAQQLCACNDTICRNDAAQDPNRAGECCEWVELFNDMDAASLGDPDGTPLGFLNDEYRGTDSNRPQLCVRVNFEDTNRNIHYVVVAVETDNRVCIQKQDPGPDDPETCGSGGVFFCESYSAPDTFVDLEFSCSGSSCPENDQSFHFRATATSQDNDDEFFCNNIDTTLPSSLQDPGPQPTVDVNPDPDPGDAGATSLTSLILPALTLVSLLATLLAFH